MNSLTQLSSQQLRQAADIQDRISSLQRELEKLLGGGSSEASAPARNGRRGRRLNLRVAKPAGRRRRMSAAARAKIAAAARARWKKAKAAGKNSL